MRDSDIRSILKIDIGSTHPRATIFDEFPVCRKGRADLVAVNAAIRGYEIKSERDTLTRLPVQVAQYDCIFDFCAVVIAERHLKHVRKIIPDHWGVHLVSGSVEQGAIVEVKQSVPNPNRQIDHIIRILWKTEGIRVLRRHGIKTPSNVSVRAVWELLKKLPVADLEESVREALKARHATAVVSQRMSGDDSRPTEPIV